MMAVFGFQLCMTLIMVTFLQKLAPFVSLGRWILCSGSLYRFLHPSNEELKKLAGKDATERRGNKKEQKSAAKRRHQNSKVEEKIDQTKETFKIPKSVDIPLRTVEISQVDTICLRKYDDFEWLVDYAVYSAIVYFITEWYYEWWKPAPEFNISMIWALLVIGFVCKNLFSIMRLYFKTETGELATSVTFGCFSFVAAMGVLVIDENILEFGLNSAYEAFAQNSTLLSFNSVYPSPAPNPVSLPVLKASIALISGGIATLLAFPGIRTAQMYADGLKYAKNNQLVQLLLHINFATPLLISMMWVKPFVRDVMCGDREIGDSTRKPLLTNDQFDVVRIIFILFLCLLKLTAVRVHLQAYLNLAFVKLRAIRREAGQITNTDVQMTVARVFFYLCVVALQYVGPVLAVMFLTMCMKTLGGHSWRQLQSSFASNHTSVEVEHYSLNLISEDSTFYEMVSSASISLARFSAVFTPMVFRSILSFFIWWLCTVWFIASCLGIVYHRYLTV